LPCFRYPYKNVPKYRTREQVGGISILAFNVKCAAECRPLFAACGSPAPTKVILSNPCAAARGVWAGCGQYGCGMPGRYPGNGGAGPHRTQH
jgi:hypothetical protein